MSVTINGTSGVTTPGIANSEGYTGDGLTIAAGAPAGALQIDSAGNAGLGVTPSAWRSGHSVIQLGGGTGLSLASGTGSGYGLFQNAYLDAVGPKYTNNGFASSYYQFNGAHQWFTAPSGTAGNPITFTQAMTLDTSGNLLVGTTTAYARLTVKGSNEVGSFTDTSGTGLVRFRNSSESTIGYIQWSGSTTAYVTSSDYRLKENIQPMTGALDKIAQLKPVTYTWKAGGSADRGFIAHELQEIIPQAVVGEKDAVDAEGNIMPQGVDYGKITPELVAAIQELKARIEKLEAK